MIELQTDNRYQVLAIDDDSELLQMISLMLSPNYEVQSIIDGKSAVEVATKSLPDIILLDVSFPDISGIEICRQLRSHSRTKKIPIIMLSGRSDIENRTLAYTEGADDYLIKPFHQQELLARIFSKIRRIEEAGARKHLIRCENLLLDTNKLLAEINGLTIDLSVLEFRLLQFLVENRDRVLSRDEILATVWKGTFVSNRTVDAHIVSLRKKLQASQSSIRTIYNAGYVLCNNEKSESDQITHASIQSEMASPAS